MDPVLSRRSIRKFTKEPLTKEDTEAILTAAMAAPTANNTRSWQFVWIEDRKLLDSVPSIHPYSRMINQAPAAVLVCADTGAEGREGYWAQNCSAATQNILIAATQRGLGSVWLGVYPNEDRMRGMRDLFKVPDGFVPFSLVVLGRPAERKDAYQGYDRDRVHHDHW
jgi:nitroreductase